MLETFTKYVFETTWSTETILFKWKIDFVSKITKLNFVDETIKSQRT